jgi:hypothetical protein
LKPELTPEPDSTGDENKKNSETARIDSGHVELILTCLIS